MFGRNGLGGVPCVCTTPVSKFGKMVLYDLCLNQEMEGIPRDYGSGSTGSDQKFKDKHRFELDDIDLALSNVTMVKFNQTVKLPNAMSSSSNASQQQVTLCAYPSGRTIGGSIWRIRHGATEVLYCMDVNLKRETVLDGAGLGLLPTSPDLLILEGGSVSRFSPSGLPASAARIGQKDKDDRTGLVASVMEVLRNDGNVLIPCESAGRGLELMQILGKYWIDNKVGLYHLVFLSHISYQILEYARSELEWMSEALGKTFYNGKPHPFELSSLKLASSVRELERLYPGPKVVIAPDPSLSFGLAKALLLRWGGDPRCKVIFTDSPLADDKSSLAAELRQKGVTLPVVAVVSAPTRMLLVGEELAAYQQEHDRLRRVHEETAQRQRREEEIALLGDAGAPTGAGAEDDDEDEDENDKTINQPSEENGQSPSGVSPTKRRKLLKTSKIAIFLEPSFPMFESKEATFPTDDYGAGTEDLDFQDITAPVFSRLRPHPALAGMEGSSGAGGMAPLAAGGGGGAGAKSSGPMSAASKHSAAAGTDAGGSDQLGTGGGGGGTSSDAPWKLVGVKGKVSFTCGFKYVPLSGRADFKAIKTVLTKIAPARVVVLRGAESDCEAVASFARTGGAEAFAPGNGEAVSFEVQTSRIRLQIPSSLAPGIKTVRGQGHGVDGKGSKACDVCSISGPVTFAVSVKDGMRVMRLQPIVQPQQQQSSTGARGVGAEDAVDADGDADEMQMQVEGEGNDEPEAEDDQLAHLAPSSADHEVLGNDTVEVGDGLSVGVVSVGEVLLNNLKQSIEAQGTGLPVEFNLTERGAVLVCGAQVVIRKDQGNDIILEGPVTETYLRARRALYQQYAMV